MIRILSKSTACHVLLVWDHVVDVTDGKVTREGNFFVCTGCLCRSPDGSLNEVIPLDAGKLENHLKSHFARWDLRTSDIEGALHQVEEQHLVPKSAAQMAEGAFVDTATRAPAPPKG